MKNDNKTIEELTSSRIKNSGTDEPSADFTQKVMQSILSENRPVTSLKPGNYFWLLGLIPVMLIISWYFLSIFKLTGTIHHLWISATNSIHIFFSTLLSFSDELESISIESTILISFIAILSLLIIEEFVSRTKRI
jgi:hypothetical protein